jgi:NCS1 family nucleobase:cation symporter-1
MLDVERRPAGGPPREGDVVPLQAEDDLLGSLEVREGDYGTRVAVVEPGGAEYIPLAERHGRPFQLFWTWTSPNLEFATVFVGVIAVSFFGLSLGQAVLALLLGTALGALSHGLLSARGPRSGVPQMVQSRTAFGWWGNTLPAGLQAVTAGIGWFAVNSVSGAFALNSLLGLPKALALVLVVAAQLTIACFGHNLVQTFERLVFPLLAVAFVLAAAFTFRDAQPSSVASSGSVGGFLLTVGAAFGYAAGWNPYASDFTRYLPADVSRRATGWWAAGGLFVSCLSLEIVGAASATVPGGDPDNPTGAFTGHLPSVVADLTLLAIALGAVSANAVNVYSGALSFTALPLRLPFSARRAVSAVGFGAVGFVLALLGLHDAGARYENFLLVIAYWIGPWLAVFFTDALLRRREQVAPLLFDHGHRGWPGVVAMLVGMAVSIPLFSNQTQFVGAVAKAHPGVGDLTFEVGFVVAALAYAVLLPLSRRRPA